MSTTPPIARVTRRFTAPAERVFAAWLDPVQASRWLFTTSTGKLVRAEIEPRMGGRFIFTDRREGEDVEHTGQYLEIDPPRRLVFTFGVPKFSAHADPVTIAIVPSGSGCELTLTQEMKPEFSEYVNRTQSGWTQILEGLAASLGEPGTAAHREPGD